MEKRIGLIAALLTTLIFTACETASSPSDAEQREHVLKMEQQRQEYQPEAPGN
ncbi:hypothetical protein [Cerasicoccus frondis]|uniref:hypothetical protein n=1 Tax=Cerasicoccus frondis TaxID=490090 RepID=UPI0028527DF3|nr:hypothetical protein [Cerasicoccus frondis]